MLPSLGLFAVPGHQVRLLGQDDLPHIQAFYEACADYSLLVDGYLPPPNAAVSLLTDRPPQKSLDDKLLLGILLPSGTLVGLLDVVKDYPEPSVWWIGLLLFKPQFRGQGLGHAVIQSFVEWVARHGARRILLGVVESNPAAFSFWQSAGFTELSRQPPQKIGDLTHVVINMGRELGVPQDD